MLKGTQLIGLLAAVVWVAGCSSNKSTKPTGDTTPPSAVSDLRVLSTTTTSVTLRWTTVGDDGPAGTATSYDLRYSRSTIVDTSWARATRVTGLPAPTAAGEPQSFTVPTLDPNTTYYFALKVADEVPNWSALSNVIAGVTRDGAASDDTIPPGAVQDLAVESTTETSAILTWTDVGDDGLTGRAAAYDLRYSTTPISEADASWANATRVVTLSSPKAAGQFERLRVDNLRGGTRYYFAMKVKDEVPNVGPLSNVAVSTTVASLDAVLIQPGTFTMGSPDDEPGRWPDETQHQVTLTKAFYVSTHEVTQSEWQTVMGWNESSAAGALHPVENVNWYDAVLYCNARSLREGYIPVYTLTQASFQGNHVSSANVTWDPNANGYRLLTEAEWEYVCRAGSTTAFSDGPIKNSSQWDDCSTLDANLDLVGWYFCNSNSESHEVSLKAANAHGVTDMHGNVWEWCWDGYDAYPADPVNDPTGLNGSTYHVLRGGSWAVKAAACRSANRAHYLPTTFDYDTGLRIARTAP